MGYIPVIGMEVHAELKTASKMFCACKNDRGLERIPNTNICPVCTGQPGALPVANKEAIVFVQRVGLALGGTINLKSKFDRKNYFYPDLPKGYQISQYDEPLIVGGKLGAGEKSVAITRIHLEEDTGRSQHPKGVNYSLVDFNRSSVPLMELVTEPDVENGEQARIFCQNLQQILRYLDVSDADMEKGQMRCEANISLYREGENRLSGTKVEVKNLNSFRSVEKAIAYEIRRQTEILESGGVVEQETRGWNENRNQTVTQRKKESAHDYRYFPEPDIPPLEFTPEYVEELKKTIPELPQAKKKRFLSEYDMSISDADIITYDKYFADYFENIISELREKKSSKEMESDLGRSIKLGVNYCITELRKHLVENSETITDIKFSAENYAELIVMIADGKINSSAAQAVLAEMYMTGDDPSRIVDAKNLSQTSDAGELKGVVESILCANEKSVADYRGGKEAALQYLVGQVMRETKGKANPQVVAEIIKKELL